MHIDLPYNYLLFTKLNIGVIVFHCYGSFGIPFVERGFLTRDPNDRIAPNDQCESP